MGQSKFANQTLTPKQDDFCRRFLELKLASVIYRETYNVAGRSAATDKQGKYTGRSGVCSLEAAPNLGAPRINFLRICLNAPRNFIRGSESWSWWKLARYFGYGSRHIRQR